MDKILTNLRNSSLASYFSRLYQNQSVQKGLFLTGLAYVSWNVLKNVYKGISYLTTKEANLITRYGANSWALVTGGSDGIGKEFAFQLAERGFNIILVARDVNKLEGVKEELLAKYPKVQVRILVRNFSEATREGFFEGISEEVKDLDVSILFNNVGDIDMNFYHLIPIAKIRSIVILNCLTQALMTRVFLPRLLARANNQVRSAIIDNASLAGEYPRPYMQVYAASKAFSIYLTEGLSYEYPNIDIMSLKPGIVETKLAAVKPDSKTCTKEQCVASTLRYLGKTKSTNGHWKHQFLSWFLNALPTPMLETRLQKNLYIMLQQVQEMKKKAAAQSEQAAQAVQATQVTDPHN